MDTLILRFDAPLISFGAPIVDSHGVIQPYPALSMMTGLIGNALGIDHRESDRLQRLQERLRYASRRDRKGRQIQDYQTVNLGAPYMDDDRAWTTRGTLETRKGGSASSGTHIRQRDYWADAVHTVALTLDPADEAPTLDEVEAALHHPARPLFLGRKPCLPAGDLVVERRAASSLVDALRHAPLHDRADHQGDSDATYPAWWPVDSAADASGTPNATRRPVTDQRDWTNQIHVGQRWIAAGDLSVESTPTSHD
ncbi:MAG: type I-E CRISPR-associated protein Cas5/CasD [Longimonas sp.]|uniref:type I-E CRISPR-associated protein Cas5/CasD n=1 Tax=Longimonas sp. TaxID=2039626 RepID=UPI00334C22E4